MFTAADVDMERVLGELSALSQIGRTPDGGITRPSLYPDHTAAVERVAGWMAAAGLDVHFDRWGNLFGRTPVAQGRPGVLSGSHLDSVRNGGNYDGPLGVISALEAVRLILRAGVELSRSLEVVSFIEEEGSRFNGLLGSQLATGKLSQQQIEALRDASGISYLDALEATQQAAASRWPIRRDDLLSERVSHYLELHIEQGKKLETAGNRIGLVTSIAGPRFLRVTLTGKADHAGTTEYEDRRDTLVCAAAIIQALRRAAEEQFDGRGRITVGGIEVRPNLANVVPGQTILEIDSRAADENARQEIAAAVDALVRQISAAHEIECVVEVLMDIAPVPLEAEIRSSIENGCRLAGLEAMEIVSWAAHDAMVMSSAAESGMIFVPCRDGRSHSPDEYVYPEVIAAGIAVLANALLQLAR